MSNPRNVNRLLQGAVASQPAVLPPVPVVRLDDRALNDAVNALRERSEVREGSRGNPYERAVTLRDLDELGIVNTGPAPGQVSAMSGVVCRTQDGQFVTLSFSALVELIKSLSA